MNKRTLIKEIIKQLTAELDMYARAASAAHAEATHEQSKAENKYDTRGLEASYLARGQSRHAAELDLSLQKFQALAVYSFSPGEPIDMTAIVELETNKQTSFYFIGPRAGGTEVTCDKQEVLVITPESPLGRQLIGKKQGEKLTIEIGGKKSAYRIVSVV